MNANAIPWSNIPPTLLRNGGGYPSGGVLLQIVKDSTDGDLPEEEVRELLERGRDIWRAGGCRVDTYCEGGLPRKLRRSAVRLIGYNLCELGRGHHLATDLLQALATEMSPSAEEAS